jgi:hypothetical protein
VFFGGGDGWSHWAYVCVEWFLLSGHVWVAICMGSSPQVVGMLGLPACICCYLAALKCASHPAPTSRNKPTHPYTLLQVLSSIAGVKGVQECAIFTEKTAS